MSFSPDDILRLSQLARIGLSVGEAAQTRTQLNDIFKLVEQLQAVDTTGVEPLAHPLAMVQPMAMRLRADEVSEVDQRDANMANAPQQEHGLFLVPKVLE
jgi:aspartyl-tRNA(Asn)/glutamyl-tRNA(Gln) amidotransferase subunit C